MAALIHFLSTKFVEDNFLAPRFVFLVFQSIVFLCLLDNLILRGFAEFTCGPQDGQCAFQEKGDAGRGAVRDGVGMMSSVLDL